MIKNAFWLAFILIFSSVACKAQQKPLLDFNDIKTLMQADPALIKSTLENKGFTLMPGTTNHFLSLFTDQDYIDLQIMPENKHRSIYIATTHPPQVDAIKNNLQTFEPKNSHGGQFYKIKEAPVSTVLIKEAPNQSQNSVSTIEIVN